MNQPSAPTPILTPRSLTALAHDLAWVCVLWISCYAMRYGFQVTEQIVRNAMTTLPVVLLIHLVCFQFFGLYRGIWRYASLHDLQRILVAITVAALLIPTAMLLWRYGQGVPRSLYVLHPLLLLLFMCGGRIVYRWWKEELPFSLRGSQGAPVLLLAAGHSNLSLVEEFRRSANWRLIGVLDDSAGTRGRSVSGVPVLGRWDELQTIVSRHAVAHAILGDSNVDHFTRRRAYELCARSGLKLMLMPQVDDVLSGRVRYADVREVELDDLLGRDPVELDTEGVSHLLQDHVVLVTGAGGTIGSELCRQIVRFRPSLLVLYEISEFALYSVQQVLEQLATGVPVRCVVGDVKDTVRLNQVFGRYRPHVVFHAAAYKHVPMMEEENAWAAVLNNSLGTYCVAEAAACHPVEKLVFVSTDKAVNPTNVMGASKRLAEMLLQQLIRRSRVPTVIVRFGNVLGSSGSVVPKFKAQIARGGPITVTHPEITRFFMSVSEASQLVLQSALMGRSGEIFVLDMGKPVKIVDLARDLIRLSGLGADDIKIEFSGLRPGEKLYEELLANTETTLATRHPKLRIAKASVIPDEQWTREVLRWLGQTEPQSEMETKAALAAFVTEYRAFRPPVAGAPESGSAAAAATPEHRSTPTANVVPLHTPTKSAKG